MIQESSHYTNAQWEGLMRTMWAKINARKQHNVPAQFSRIVLDMESDATAFGQHNRLTASAGIGNDKGTWTVREDHGTGPRRADTSDVYEALLRDWPGARGAVIGKIETGATLGKESTWWYFSK